MKIIENYLPNTVFKNIKEQIEATTFPWYYNDYSTHPNSEPQLVHSFLYKNIPSSYTGILQPILEEIPAQQFLRIKGNLNWQTSKIIETGEHIDSDDSKLKSAIFFINNCDGYCRVGEKIIKSEENKLLIINYNTKHNGTTTTNSKRRIVINFVYIPYDKRHT